MYEIIKRKAMNIPLDEIIAIGKRTSNRELQEVSNILKAIKLESLHPEMDRNILVIEKVILHKILDVRTDGKMPQEKEIDPHIIKEIIRNCIAIKRSHAEYNKRYIQITTNTLIRNIVNEKFFILNRTLDSTDIRVAGSHGMPGGHIYLDGISPYGSIEEIFNINFNKKIHEEIIGLPDMNINNFERLVYLPQSKRAADNEHLGLVFYVPVRNNIKLNDTNKNNGIWLALHEIAELLELNPNNIDSWTTAILHYYFRKPYKGLDDIVYEKHIG